MSENPSFADLKLRMKNSTPNLETEKAKDKKNQDKQIWICKPGENSNRGNGIVVLSGLD